MINKCYYKPFEFETVLAEAVVKAARGNIEEAKKDILTHIKLSVMIVR